MCTGRATERRKKKNVLLGGMILLGVISCFIGVILLNTYVSYDTNEIIIDYTDCTSYEKEPHQIKCKDELNTTRKKCYCYISIDITELMKKPVTAYYELELYDQTFSSYFQSRDDNQLAGQLSLPSETCGSYTYACTVEGRKPIAPCGQLADAMFNDTFRMLINNTFVAYIKTGLVSEEDKKLFHNPPGNLSQALKNFSKPMNWDKNVWELDTNNSDNNGFQNEAFIIWMKTDLRRKPAWRVRHEGIFEHGLPAANYTLKIEYGYPTSRYNGRRKFILRSVNETVSTTRYAFGIGLLVIGLLCSGVVGLLYLQTVTAEYQRVVPVTQ